MLAYAHGGGDTPALSAAAPFDIAGDEGRLLSEGDFLEALTLTLTLTP